MNVTVLGSGSRGNAVAVTAGGVSLLLDAGFGPKILGRRAEEAGVDLNTLIGIVLTHEHGDHSRGAARLAQRWHCPVYASGGTLTALAPRLADVRRHRLRPHYDTQVGPFTIAACRTVHDAAEPLALKVTGPVPGASVGLAYDLGRPTAAVRYLLRDAACLLVEANHDEIMLRTGPYPPVVRTRIAGSGGHLSNRAAAELLAELCRRRTRTVVLVHVSDQCNRPDLAQTAVDDSLRRVGFRGALLIAPQDRPLRPVTVCPETTQLELGVAG